MNQFLSQFPPQVQAEIVKGTFELFIALSGGAVVLLVKFKYRRVKETQNDKKSTFIEFEGGFKKT